MGAEDSTKKLKRTIAKKIRNEDSRKRISHAAQIEGNNSGAAIEEKKKKKKSSREIRVKDEMVQNCHVKDETLETSGVQKKSRKLGDRKGKKSRVARRDTEGSNGSHVNEVEHTFSKVFNGGEPDKEKSSKSRKKKRKNVDSTNHFGESSEKSNASEQCNDAKLEEQFSNCGEINNGDSERKSKKGKSRKSEKIKKKRPLVANQLSSDNLLDKKEENPEDEVYQMSSGDEDCSKGMKKWILQYHQSRPGLKVLQQRIDGFIMAHEAKEEQARAEKLAQAAEGGWTVVVHQKGRKKTTDAESGIAVGAVAQAAVLDKMAKKKKNEVGLAFYQFHKREAHRNEIMMLQSKFEQDKKRIQQMRAARKFRPY